MIKTLIISGGAVNGIALIGCLKFLEKKRLLANITTLWCTSIGSLLGLCLILGYNSLFLEKLLIGVDLSLLYHINTNIDKFFVNYGIDDGKNIKILLKNLLMHKLGRYDITLLELYEKYRIVLNINTTCLDTLETVIFNHINYPDLKVFDIVLISMRIPLYYHRYKIEGKYYCDGCIMNNWCINLLDDPKDCLALMIVNSKYPVEINSMEDYCIQILKCIYFRDEINIMEKYRKYIVEIDCNSLTSHPLNFNIDNTLKYKITQEGYQHMHDYYKKHRARFKKSYKRVKK